MITTIKRKEFDPQNFWLYTEESKQLNPIFYPANVCKSAEHRFVAFLVVLDHLSIKAPETITSKIISYDEKKTTPTTLIKKTSIFGARPNLYSYDAGIATLLALTGISAGTICCFAPQLNTKKNMKSIQAKRPFHDHGFVHEHIRKDIKNSPRFSPVHYKFQIQILKKTQRAISQHGLLPALFFYLNKLNINHDSEQIIYNNKQVPLLQK